MSSPTSENHAVRREHLELVRQTVLSDSYWWDRIVCQHTELSPLFHRPLAYVIDGDAHRLVGLLNDRSFCERSYSAREIAKQLTLKHGIDWNSFAGFRTLIERLDFVSIVAYRGSAKSSLGHDNDALAITRDPDNHTLLVSASDDRAIAFHKQVRDIVSSPLYRLLFPDRFPDDPNKDLTESQIRLKGRTLGKSPQPSLESKGYTARITSAHYRRFSIDDLLIDTNLYDVDGANNFLAGLTGLYEPTRIIRRHYHTVYHERGDQWVLSRIPTCLQLVIPVEYYEGGEQPDDISVRGIATNPEWHPEEKIAKLYEEVVADPRQGPRSWRMNYLLDPSAGGGAVFPAAIVDDRVWQWVPHPDVHKKEKLIGRPLYDAKGNRAGFKGVDPKGLYIVIGCDQAISDLESSDEWSVCLHGKDSDGCEYILKTLHGHGLEQMLDAILFLDAEAAKQGLRVRQIGLEKAGFQGATKKWIDSDVRFRSIRHRVIDIPHSGKNKEIVLQNAVAEPMKSRRFFTAADDPGCADGREQAKDFKPFVKRRRDDILDSWAIGSATSRTPAKKDDLDKKSRDAYRRYQQNVDPETGLYLGY